MVTSGACPTAARWCGPERERWARRIRYGVGAAAGAGYGAWLAYRPGGSFGQGGAYGAALYVALHEALPPLLGLAPGPWQMPAGWRATSPTASRPTQRRRPWGPDARVGTRSVGRGEAGTHAVERPTSSMRTALALARSE